MICLNRNSPEVQYMMEVSGLDEIVLGALVNMWMEDNPGKEFPTLKDLGIEPVIAPSSDASAGFIRIILENYDVSLSGDRYKYKGNTYNEKQILNKLLGVSVSNNGVVTFNAKKFFEANKFVLDDIQEATRLSETDAIAMYQNYVTSSENPVNNLFNVSGFVDSMSIDYVEDAIIDEVDEVEDLNQRLKSGFLKDFNFTTEEYNDLKKALNINATQAVSLVEKFIALKDGAQMDKSVAYIAYSLLGKANSKIRSELRYNIRSWDKYSEKFEKYKKEVIEEKGFIDDKQKWKNLVRDKIIIDYLAETIVEYHNNPQQFEKIESKKWSKKDFSFIKKLYRAIIDFLGLNKPNSNKLKNVANAIANEVLTREYDILNYELAEGQILKGYEETINSDQRAKEIVTYSQNQGIILTGSLALRKAGKVYRTAEENLHDLDFVVPYNLTNFDKETLRDAFLEYKRIGLDPKDGIQASQFLFKKFIEKSEWFVNFKKQYPSYRIVNQFVGSEHMDSFSSVTLTGVIDGKFDKDGKYIEGTGYIIDHFVRLGKMQEEHENYFKLWKEIMIAKLMMGRAKDFIDFKAFVPFLASKDSYNFYYSDYVYLSKDEIVPANKKVIIEGKKQAPQGIETNYIKPGVEDLFESNPELANQVYEALGFEIPTTKLKGRKAVEGKLVNFDVIEELASAERSDIPSSILIKKLLNEGYLPKINETDIVLGGLEYGIWRPNLKKIEAQGENKSTLAKKVGHELLHSVTHNIIYSYQNLKGVVDFNDKYNKDNIRQGYIKPVDLTKSQIEALDNLVRIRNKVVAYVEQNKDKIQKQDRGFGTYDYFIRTNYTESETDLHEFISEVFTNPELINILKEIPSEGKKSNLFKDFVDAIAKILGFTNTSILEDVIAYSEEAFFSQPQITQQQKQEAQQLYSAYLDTIFPDSKVKDIVYHDTSHSKAIKNYKKYLQGKYDKKIDYINKETFGDPNYIEVFFKDGTSEILDEKESFNFIPFETFDKNFIGNIDGSISGEGFYFYTNPKERYDRSRFFTLNTLINIKNTANKSDLNLKDLFEKPNKSTDLLKKQGYDSVIGKLSTIGTEYIVFEPEQIHILGSQKDIEGFKEFISSENIQYKKDTSIGIKIVEPKKSLALGQGSTTELDLAIRSYMLENPDATTEQVVDHLALSGIINLDCSNTGLTKAKDGLTNSVSGTGWSIVKDFKGKPKHSQGGYDITIKDDGFYMGDIKAENGLLIMNQDPIYKTKLTDQEEKQFKDWYNKVSKYKNLDPNPDSEEQYYDYRGYWKNENRDEILKENTNAHFIDRYKVPGHPTFSNESMYSNDKTPGGSWSTGKDGTWYFTHSPYTVKYSDRTAEYLDGTGEFSIIGQDTIRNPNDYYRAINKLKINKP